MTFSISDFSELKIYITDTVRNWYIPKFRLEWEINEPFITIFWEDPEKGTPGIRRSLTMDYQDVEFGYTSPSSATEIASVFDNYIISAWTNIIALIGPSTSIFTLGVQHTITNYPAGSTLYFGNMPTTPVSGLPERLRISIMRDCTLKKASVLLSAFANIGTNEDISLYVRVNDTTDYLIATVGLAQRDRLFENTAMNVSFVTGDFYFYKVVCPSWGTAPTSLALGGYLEFETI